MPYILAAVAIISAYLAWRLWRGLGRLGHLADSPRPSRPPRVDVVVAARNEGHTIEPAMRSLLAQRGLDPRSRIIAVDDRSEDNTGEVLARLASADDRLHVITIDSLPEGWLGKNHALWQGAVEAEGDWLLFTDADVVMAPEAVARAAGLAEAQGLQHVTAMPEVIADSPSLRIMIIQFAISFLAVFRPWRLPDDPRCFAGLGAFNLVATTAYRRVDGHRAIALTPLDDILLGRLLRRDGGASRLVLADGLMHIAWYPDTRTMIRAFRKNGFAAFDYRVSRLLGATGLYLALGLMPWLALLIPDPLTRGPAATAVAIQLALQGWLARRSGWPVSTAALAPFGTALIIWMWWRASVTTLWQGGIEWRGTHYPLAQLRAHHERIRWS